MLFTLLMGLCLSMCFYKVIVFLICFIALRKYAGGYHADTQKRCYVISVLIIAVALWATRYKSDNSVCFCFYTKFKFYNFCVFLFLVDSKNRRLEQWEKEKIWKKSKSTNILYVYVVFDFVFG